MRSIILGAGMIAHGIIDDLINYYKTPPADIAVVDTNEGSLNKLSAQYGIDPWYKNVIDINPKSFSDYDIIISTLPYDYNLMLTKAAIEAKVNMVDLGGNNNVVMSQLELCQQAKDAGILIVPDCGLAPGLASILAIRALNVLEVPKNNTDLADIKVRVGGLPLKQDNPLKYQICFSVHGLINEYIEPVEIVRHGRLTAVDPMTGVEQLSLDRFNLEAFYTSGGISTLARSMANSGNINLDYKTIRYAGHCYPMAVMLKTFVPNNRQAFEDLLYSSLPRGGPDMIIIRVIGRYNDRTYSLNSLTYNTHLSSMAIMTACPTTIIASMIVNGLFKRHGVFTIEDIIDNKMINYIFNSLSHRGINLKESYI